MRILVAYLLIFMMTGAVLAMMLRWRHAKRRAHDRTKYDILSRRAADRTR